MKKTSLLVLLFSFICLKIFGDTRTSSKTVTVGETFTVNPVTLSGLSTSNVLTGSATFPNTDGLAVSPTNHDVHIVGENKPGWSNSLDGRYTTYSVKALKTGTYVIQGSASRCKKYWFRMSGKYVDYYVEERESGSFTLTVTVVDVTKISIPSSKTLTIGETYTFSPTITDSRATTTLKWTSSDTSVATINSSGKLTAKGVGTTTITCTASNGVSATCKVTVNPVKATSVSLNTTQLELTKGENKQLTATVKPSNATYKSVTWTSSDDNVAMVDYNGNVTGISIGNCTITATTAEGLRATCAVTVKAVLASDISLDYSSLMLLEGDKMHLKATILPENVEHKDVAWRSSNENVAIVDGDGWITAISSGTCQITASTVDGSKRTANCSVTVYCDLLYANDAVGVPSGTLTLPILLNNKSDITGFQFELQLPEGVSVETDNHGAFMAKLSDRVVDQSLSCSMLSNGNYQFIVFSGSSSALHGDNGAVAYVTLKIAANTVVDDYAMQIKNVELTNTGGMALYQNDVEFRLKLTDVIIGDTNGDGKVTVTDAVGVVNHILERTPSAFIPKAADVNGDGLITITDAVGIINIILNQ